ncbi:MAG: transporter substrate-binding domain-containing protein [Eubacteriales bacterium]
MIKFLLDLYDSTKRFIRDIYRHIEKRINKKFILYSAIVLAVLIISIIVINSIPKAIDYEVAIKPFKDNGMVTVGLKDDMGGFSTYDEETDSYIGLDADLSNEIIRRLFDGTDILINQIGVDSKSGRVNIIREDADLVFAQYIYEDDDDISYTDPYFTDSVAFFAPEDGIDSIAEVSGKKIGVVSGSYAGNNLSKFFEGKNIDCEILTYASYPDVFNAMTRGKIDAVAAGSVMINKYVTEGNISGRMLEGTILPHGYTIAYSSSNPELGRALNEIISKLKEDGTLKELIAKWGLNEFQYGS